MTTVAMLIMFGAAGGAAILLHLDRQQRSRAQSPNDDDVLIDDSVDVVEPEDEGEFATDPVERRRGGLQLPGSVRRERRAWAEANGYAFTRTDDYLVDEWTRGAAASGAPARDIVSGAVYGHEMLLMDLGGTNVMAMRTGSVSDIVIDIRRSSMPDAVSHDLVLVEDIGDFRMFANKAEVGRRLVDIRVTTALEQLPETVEAVWMESDWVLAQTDRQSTQQDWDETTAPLALLADAARALPPRASEAQTLDVQDFTPSRPLRSLDHDAPRVLTPVAEPDLELMAEAPVVRPEEPLELPSRTRGVYRGTVEPRDVGGDIIEPIAAGEQQEEDLDTSVTRMPRRFTAEATIFDDVSGAEKEGEAHERP